MSRFASFVPLLAVACSAGCAGPTADVTVTVNNSAGSPEGAPGTIEVHLFDDTGLLGGARVADPQLPGAVKVTDLPASASALRVIAVGYVGVTAREALLAGTSVFHAHGPMDVALDLSPVFDDADGDAVPDQLDDCPATFDPDQRRSNGRGPGDACR